MLKKSEAIARALAAGATMAEIEAEAARAARQVGTTPFKNMMRALNMMTYKNTRADWTRLAAAHVAQSNARRAKRAA